MRSLVLVLVPAMVALLAACDPSSDDGCPGETIARMAMHGTLDAAATGCVVPPQGGWVVPATLPDGSPDATTSALFSWDGAAQRLAYCTGGSKSAVLYGTREGDHLHAQVTVDGAILGLCAPTCTPLMTVVVDGELASGASPRTFTGTLTETFDGSTGDCGTCRLPCTSTYALTGTEQ